MFKSTLAIFALIASSIAAPAPEFIVERHIVEVYKRQADISQLLQLASLAGVTALPTDPAVLLQLGPLANSLASALPTSSVLGVLLTAAPSGFVSSIVNDPSYASSFESAFSAGNSPAWFNSLPTSVRSYLHTYSGFGGLAGAGAAIKSVTADAGNGTAAATGSGMSTSSASPTTQNSAQSAASVSSASAAYVAAADATSTGSTEGNTAIAQGGTASSSKGGAARPTGAVAAGLAGTADHIDENQQYFCFHPGCEGSFYSENLLDLHVKTHFKPQPDANYGVHRAYGLHPFMNDTTPRVTYTKDTYGGVGLHVGNFEAGISTCGYATAPGLPRLAVQYAELGPYTDINGSINPPSNLLSHGQNYLGRSLGNSLGNVTTPGTAYGQSAYTAGNIVLSPQTRNIADGVYNASNVDAGLNPFNNATTTTMADGSGKFATYERGLGARSSGTTPNMSSTRSPSTPGSVAGPNGRPRWACTGCVKTFSRQADMERHAKKHSGVLPYQCNVAGCGYRGSYRQDKLDQHRRNCH